MTDVDDTVDDVEIEMLFSVLFSFFSLCLCKLWVFLSLSPFLRFIFILFETVN